MTLINNVMRLMHKVLFNLGLLVAILILIYAFYLRENVNERVHNDQEYSGHSVNSANDKVKPPSEKLIKPKREDETINLWCIFTKVDRNSNLKYKFETFSKSILSKSSKPIILNVITDDTSRSHAEEVLVGVQRLDINFRDVSYHNVSHLAEKLKRLVSIMSPHFSSRPGTYYSDALFFLSLGLHHIINPSGDHSNRAVMMDVDIKVVGDVAELWSEFNNFGPDALFGLGPELSPVYRHVFHSFRSTNPGTHIGEPLSEKGYPGVNSGVILLNLENMRKSKIYSKFIGDDMQLPVDGNDSGDNQPSDVEGKVKGRAISVDELVKKYNFRGHLGDQDFYTLLGAEYPELLHIIPCIWNRQLCTWWGERGGYGDVFDKYFKCEGKIKIYHGNCNTPFPKEAE